MSFSCVCQHVLHRHNLVFLTDCLAGETEVGHKATELQVVEEGEDVEEEIEQTISFKVEVI